MTSLLFADIDRRQIHGRSTDDLARKVLADPASSLEARTLADRVLYGSRVLYPSAWNEWVPDLRPWLQASLDDLKATRDEQGAGR